MQDERKLKSLDNYLKCQITPRETLLKSNELVLADNEIDTNKSERLEDEGSPLVEGAVIKGEVSANDQFKKMIRSF